MRAPLLAVLLPFFLLVHAAAQAPPPDTDAIHQQITSNNRAVGHAIAAGDFAALETLWSPGMIVNSPGNNILTRAGVFRAMREDKLKYTSVHSVPETFSVFNDIAVEMGHEEVVLASGPAAGKPLARRWTDIWQRTGDHWVQIARQATIVGIDGATVYAPAKDK